MAEAPLASSYSLARTTRKILPDLSVEIAKSEADTALLPTELAKLGADLASEAFNLQVAIRRARSANDPTLPVSDARFRSHAHRVDLWHRRTCVEESKGNESLSIAMTRLFDGRRSDRGRQVQANRNRKTAIG